MAVQERLGVCLKCICIASLECEGGGVCAQDSVRLYDLTGLPLSTGLASHAVV